MIDKDIQYGIHSVAILDRENGYLPVDGGYLEILGNVTFNQTIEGVPLNGGSSLDAFAFENGIRSTEISMLVRQFKKGQFEKFAAAISTSIAASALGTVGVPANTKGVSIIDATTGVASIAATSGSEGDLKEGTYFVKATSATTFNLYSTTDIDFLEGADVSFQDEELKLLAVDLTLLGTGGTVDVAGFGLTFTGGSGAIALVADDVAIFEVSREHGGINSYTIGNIGTAPGYVGLEFYSQKMSDNTKWKIRLPKVKLNGLPMAFNEKAFGEAEVTGAAVRCFDPVEGEEVLAVVREIKSTSAC
jgi:hypothetical protein